MNMNKKGFSNIALLIILVVIVAGVAGYFVMIQKPTTPTQSNPSENTQTQTQPNTQNQVSNLVEYRWGILKFKYPSNWKVAASATSIVLTPSAKTSFFLIPSAQAASDDSITIGGQKSCSTLGQGYRCETAFGLPIYTASNNSETLTAFQEVSNSAALTISSRDVETGIAMETTYTVNNKTYTEKELNSYLKKAPAGRYDIVAKSNGYKELPSYVVLPVSQNSGMRFMIDPLAKPSEFGDSYLKQFTKPGTGLVVGFVVDEDGQSLSGVAVSSPVYNAITNNRGFYALNATIPESASCAGVDITFSKSGYRAEKHLHAMSGSVIPHQAGGDYASSLWDGGINITLQKGSGQNVTDDKHKLCP